MVDKAGNVYVAVVGYKQVLKLAAGSNNTTTLPFTGVDQPMGVAVDSAGNLYVSDHSNNRVVKLPVQ